MLKPFWARFGVLAAGVFIGLAACDQPTGDPIGIDDLQSSGNLIQVVTSDLARTLTPQGRFPVLEGAEGTRPMIGGLRAGELAVQFIASYGRFNRHLLERQHGAPIDFSALKVGGIVFAESPHASLPNEVPNFVHKYFGPFFLVTLEANGQPKVRVAVSAHAGDIAFEAGGLVYHGGENARGNEFRWEGVRASSPPISAEEAAMAVAGFASAKVTDIPVFLRRDGSFSPFHGYWKIRLDRAVEVLAGDAHDRISTTAKEFFLDDRGNLMVSAGDRQPRQAAQPALRAPQSRRYRPVSSGPVRTVKTPPNILVPVDLVPVVAPKGVVR